jgi:hypothetical protein
MTIPKTPQRTFLEFTSGGIGGGTIGCSYDICSPRDGSSTPLRDTVIHTGHCTLLQSCENGTDASRSTTHDKDGAPTVDDSERHPRRAAGHAVTNASDHAALVEAIDGARLPAVREG